MDLVDEEYGPPVIELAFAARIKGVEGIYNRHDYFDERKVALNEWAKLLSALEDGRQDYNVVPLRSRKPAA